ncbi:hypothetical protein [Helicobacter sp. T3_23-1059]
MRFLLSQIRVFLSQNLLFIAMFFASFFFTSCSTYFLRPFAPQTLEEKKIQATRSVQIIKDNQVETMVFATFLNDIEHSFYPNLMYFFVEITDANHRQINLARFSFSLIDKQGNKHAPNYIKEFSKDEFDEIISPLNKWSQCYLVAFDKSSNIDEKNISLQMIVDDESYALDFSFYILPFSII